MSDFPKGGDIEATRDWLDKKGFQGLFLGWEADAILGADKAYVLKKAGEDEGEMLWGFLNTARITTGNFFISFMQSFVINLIDFSFGSDR